MNMRRKYNQKPIKKLLILQSNDGHLLPLTHAQQTLYGNSLYGNSFIQSLSFWHLVLNSPLILTPDRPQCAGASFSKKSGRADTKSTWLFSVIHGISGVKTDKNVWLFVDSSKKWGASLVRSVGSMVSLLTRWYWVRIPVGLALHLISPHPRVCK